MGLIYSNIPELEGSKTEIVLTNLSEIEPALESVIEKRLANISELAEAILQDGGEPDIVKSIILSIKSEGTADSGNMINQNRQTADAIFSKFSLVERLTLFKELCGRINEESFSVMKHFLKENEISVSTEASERIAYLKNSYNDIAFMQFSALLNSPRAAYFESVSNVCESVFNGECEYCILPIETSGDGKLLSFYELIMKYDYKINAVYDLHGDGGYTRYALIGRKYGLGSIHKLKSRNKYLELVMRECESPSLDEMLSAASFCSLKLRRIDTLNAAHTKNSFDINICPAFRVDGADLQSVLTYLTIDCPDVTILGVYTQI